MAWVSVHQQIRDHRKTRDLYRKLNISRPEAIGTLVLIWTWAIDNCNKDGKLFSVTKEDICQAAYWTKNPDVLYKALIDTEWLDEVGEDLYLHDWYDFNKPFYDYKDRKDKDKLRKRNEKSTGNSTEIPQEPLQEFHDSHSPAPSPAPSQLQEPYLDSNDIVDKPLKNKFIKPTLEQVKDYCRERNNTVDPESWIDHYISNGWLVGNAKAPMKDWKAAVRTWEKGNNKKQGSDKSDTFYMDLAKKLEKERVNQS
jgi:hypothetical protein